LASTITQRANYVYFVFARSEKVPFSIKSCECLFPVDRCHEGDVGAAFTRVSKNGISLSHSNSMVNLILL